MLHDYLNFNLNLIATILVEVFISKQNKNYPLSITILIHFYFILKFIIFDDIHHFNCFNIHHL